MDLTLIKIFSIVVATIVLIIGEFVGYKSNERINRWGWVALSLLIITIPLAVYLELSEKQNADAENQIQVSRYKSNIDTLARIIKTTDSTAQLSKILFEDLNYVTSKTIIEANSNYLRHLQNLDTFRVIGNNFKNLFQEFETQNTLAKILHEEQIDSLKQVTQKLIYVAKLSDKLNYPLSPIEFTITLHCKLANKLFAEYGGFQRSDFDSTSNSYSLPWITFYNNKTAENQDANIHYEFWGFPKFLSEEKFINEFLRNITFGIEFERDSSVILKYPELRSIVSDVEYGVLYVYYNHEANYNIELFYDEEKNEIIMTLHYKLESLKGAEYDYLTNSLLDLDGCKMKIFCGFTPDLSVQKVFGYVSTPKTDTTTTKHKVKQGDSIIIHYETIISTTLKGKDMIYPLTFDIDSVFMEPKLLITYGTSQKKSTVIALDKSKIFNDGRLIYSKTDLQSLLGR